LAKTVVLQEFSASDLIANQCASLPSGGVGDATLSSQGRVFLSWFTLRFPEYSLSILSHEFGHAISLYLRKVPPFSTTLDCIANRNPNVLKPLHLSLNYADDSRWTEEDWADHFSSLILIELNSKEPNLGCALLKEDDKSYLNNSYGPTDGDPHSAGLLRLMMIAIDRGQMNTVCQPLVAYAPAHGRELQCR
jgi:hypothetical protein